MKKSTQKHAFYKSNLAKRLGYANGTDKNGVPNGFTSTNYYNQFIDPEFEEQTKNNPSGKLQQGGDNTKWNIGVKPPVANSNSQAEVASPTDPNYTSARNYDPNQEAKATVGNFGADQAIGNIPGFGQYYGLAKAGEGLGRSMVKRDENGNAINDNQQIADSWMTSTHEQAIDDASKGNYGYAVADMFINKGLAGMLGKATGNDNLKRFANSNRNAELKTDYIIDPETGRYNVSGYHLEDPNKDGSKREEKTGRLKNGGNVPYKSNLVQKLNNGGVIKGAGTAKSDSINAKVKPETFIVPAENSGIAKKIAEMYLGKSPDEAAKPAKLNQGGGVPVKLSNGEYSFTPNEKNKLLGMGINLEALAPNADNGYKSAIAKNIFKYSNEFKDGTPKGGVPEKQRFSDKDYQRYLITSEYDELTDEEKKYLKSKPFLTNEQVSLMKKNGVPAYLKDRLSKYDLERINDDFISKEPLTDSEKRYYNENKGRLFADTKTRARVGVLAAKQKAYDDNVQAKRNSANTIDLKGVNNYDPTKKSEAAVEIPSASGAEIEGKTGTTTVKKPSAGSGGSGGSGGSAAKKESAIKEQPKTNTSPAALPKIETTNPSGYSWNTEFGTAPSVVNPNQSLAYTTKMADESKNSPYEPSKATVNNVTPTVSNATPTANTNNLKAPNDYAGIYGLGQGIMGLVGLSKLKRPVDERDPVFESQLDKTLKMADYGYSPEQKSYLAMKLAEDRNNALANVYNAAGGNGAVALNNARQVFNDDYMNRLQTASTDEQLRLQKQGSANQMAGIRAEKSRQLFGDRMNDYLQKQSAYANLLNTGGQNIIGSQRYKNNYKQIEEANRIGNPELAQSNSNSLLGYQLGNIWGR